MLISLAGLLSWGIVSTGAAGQPRTGTDTVAEKHRQSLQAGVEQARSGEYGEAIQYLSPLFERREETLDCEGQDTLLYWLGEAYRKQGLDRDAVEVWGRQESAGCGNGVDPRIADAFIRTVVENRFASRYETMEDQYLDLLEQIDRSRIADTDNRIIRRHLRELAPVLPTDIQNRTGLTFDRKKLTAEVDLKPDAGSILVGWWRGQDPLPATRGNERLREHLQRVITARERFVHEGKMDDRGKVYIRLGEPRRNVSVGMDDQETTTRIEGNLRRNEFWTYPEIDQKAYYLFIEKDPGIFEVGGVMDVFKPDLMPGPEYLSEMEKVLRDLATFQGDYGLPAAEAFDRASWNRNNQQYNIGTDPVEGTVEDFVRQMEDRMVWVDRQNASRRRDRVPSSHTRITDRYPDLPVESRVARFLTSEGDTRLEVYWSLPTASLNWTEELRSRVEAAYDGVPDDSTFLLLFSGIQENPAHIDELARHRRYIVRPSGRPGAALRPRTFTTTIEDSLFHVGLQWGQYTYERGDDGQLKRKSVLRRHTEHEDTLQALNSDEDMLEMSDLKLLTSPGRQDTEAASLGNMIPHPFSQISVNQSLALRFEVYHLNYDADDRTRYQVAYRVEAGGEEGQFLGLFGDDEAKQTSTESTVEGTSRTAEELILLDLKDLVQKNEATPLSITVTVQDDVTGQTVSRSADVTILPK